MDSNHYSLIQGVEKAFMWGLWSEKGGIKY